MEIPVIQLPPVNVSTSLYFGCIIVSLLSHIFQVPNHAARVKSAGKAHNAQNAMKAKQPASKNNTDVNINLESLSTTRYVFLV